MQLTTEQVFMTLLIKNSAIAVVVENISWYIRIPGAVTHLKRMVEGSINVFYMCIKGYFMSFQPLGNGQDNPTENKSNPNDDSHVIQKKLHHIIHLKSSYTTILEFASSVVDLFYEVCFDQCIDHRLNIRFLSHGSQQLKGFIYEKSLLSFPSFYQQLSDSFGFHSGVLARTSRVRLHCCSEIV